MTSIVYMAPKNAHIASTLKFCDHFRALRLSWTANTLKSEGMEQFIDEFLPKIRENNPQIRYYLQRHIEIDYDPFVVGEYVWCRKRIRRGCWKNKHQILAMVEEMALGGTFFDSKRSRVTNCLPRGLEIRSSETIGHNVYKVLSKWKSDPKDPKEITTEKHPHYTPAFNIGKHKKIKKVFEVEEEEIIDE